MAVEFGDSQLVKMLDQRQEAGFVGRYIGVRRPKQEGLIALVAAAVDQVGGFGVTAGDDKARNAHDVELKAGRVQSLVLLVLCHKHFAALMAALLGARALVFDMVAATPASTKRRMRLRTCGSPPWPVSASAMMNGRKS